MLSSSSSVDKGASSNNFQANVFQPEKKRRRRDGYEDGDYILFKEGTAADFIQGADPVSFLGGVNKISFETDEEKEYDHSSFRLEFVSLRPVSGGVTSTSQLQTSSQTVRI